jgi:hypothetical protein
MRDENGNGAGGKDHQEHHGRPKGIVYIRNHQSRSHHHGSHMHAM